MDFHTSQKPFNALLSLEIQNYGSESFLLILADFALTVEIPYRPGERFERVCVWKLQNIVNMVRQHNVGFIALESTM